MKRNYFIVFLIFLSLCFLGANSKKKSIIKEKKPVVKKVVMIIAKNGFRDEEYLQPKDILTKAKIEIVTASSSKGIAKGMLGATVSVDVTIDEINIKDYVAVIFVGGSGSEEYWDNKQAHKIARETVKYKDKILAAICIAPVTLARAGVLKGKKATVFSSEEGELKKYGVNYTGKNVEVDGKIVTASGPQAAKEFGQKVLGLVEVEN
ncbi:MAG: DJ-1/PfpI family protein [Elusimicrobia bacterium]|nr:DJ-1/PfpI family protein [Elusimicrobiota bacterium]